MHNLQLNCMVCIINIIIKTEGVELNKEGERENKRKTHVTNVKLERVPVY